MFIPVQECSDLFSSGGADKLAGEYGLRFLGKIPLDQVRCKQTVCVSARLAYLHYILFDSLAQHMDQVFEQDAGRLSHMNLVNSLAYHEPLSSSEVKAPDWCPGDHGFLTRWDS